MHEDAAPGIIAPLPQDHPLARDRSLRALAEAAVFLTPLRHPDAEVGGAPLWGLQQIPCRDPEQRVGEVATAIPDPGGLVRTGGGEATHVEGGRRVAVPAFAAVEIVKGRCFYEVGTG